MTVDELVFLFKSNTKPLFDGLNAAQSKVKSFVDNSEREFERGQKILDEKMHPSSINGAGIFATLTAGLLAVRKVMNDNRAFGEFSVQVNKVANAIGISTNAVQSFQKVARLSGDGVGELTGKMKSLQDSMFAFRTYGTVPEQQLIALSRLGMSTADIYDSKGKLRPMKQIAQTAYKNARALGYDKQYATYLMQQAGLFSEGVSQKVFEGRFDELVNKVETTNSSADTIATGIEAFQSAMMTEWSFQRTEFQALAKFQPIIDAGNQWVQKILDKIGSHPVASAAAYGAAQVAGAGAARWAMKRVLGDGKTKTGDILEGYDQDQLDELGRMGREEIKQTQYGGDEKKFRKAMEEKYGKKYATNDEYRRVIQEKGLRDNINLPQYQLPYATIGNTIGWGFAGAGVMMTVFQLLSRITTPEQIANTKKLNKKSADFYSNDDWDVFTGAANYKDIIKPMPTVNATSNKQVTFQPNSISFNITAENGKDLVNQLETEAKPTIFRMIEEYDAAQSAESGGGDFWLGGTSYVAPYKGG